MAFAFGFACVHALGNVWTLPGDDVLNVDLVGVKNVVVVHVTDFTHGVAHDLVDRHDRLERFSRGQIGNRDLATDDDSVALGERLAGDATVWILPQAGVENGIGNGIADFVRMTFPDGFGSKNETTKHVKKGFRFQASEEGRPQVSEA